MSSRRKGNRLEKERQVQFEQADALVLRAPQVPVFLGPGRFINRSADFFGVGDLLVFRVAESPLLVSISTLNNVAPRRRKMGERVEELSRYGIACEVHVRKDRGPWRIWQWKAGESGFTFYETHDYLTR
jgi:hypothetical protein